ncbi:glycerophosphodiester phosphodiesterase family protein [Aliidiomarina sanyensis]|uniref:Glycerophosphodiester phosphodiesterase n=1 Tax=Aliidiomarina sanyensis TaxID=1249555 RepID=A0A432WIB7_9GAMM|nr:glycerophosphodiester phosphodiesterase family protein [Aliidiomarina sanyensis]RUO33513.1 glycerophosphodiester phosphodiesterase [Aliidiomarina sanyensis]
MIRLTHLKRDIVAAVRYHRKPLLAFHLYFALFAFALWAPVTGWLLQGLIYVSGEPAIGNEALLAFAVTPVGGTWILLALTFAAVLIFFQHAGMMLIASRDARGRFHSATSALWQVVLRLPKLLLLGLIQVMTHLILALPVIALVAFSFQALLGAYDIYYVINVRPVEFWQFLGVLGFAVVLLVAVNGNLYLRWMLALPILLMEHERPWVALRRSAELTRSVRLRLAIIVVSVAAVVAVIPVLVSLLFDGMGWLLLSILPEHYAVQIGILLVLLALFAAVNLLAAFFGVSVNSLLTLKIYHRRCQRARGVTVDHEPRYAGWCAAGVEFAVVVIAVAHLVLALNAFSDQEEILNIAHRGNSWDAPENTLAAIERAIQDGADYIELDVRHTADGVLVLKHDRDMLRVAGDPRAIWEIRFEELRALDAGSWFDPAFAGEPVPTLAEAVEVIRGRAGLYLETKGAPQMPHLVPMVMEELASLDMLEDTIFASLSVQDLIQAKQLQPDLRTSLLVHTAVGVVERQPFEILAMRDALVTPARLSRVRRQGQALHVWTVNDPHHMRRFLDVGVDGIITDRPDVLADMMRERAEMNRAERLLMRLRYWLWD